ncbi:MULTISPECIES: hypothetical protein [Nocardiopsidaceae]|uniref:Uncharacterized protein n=1 Tax=Streptomonospora nanhaiensis TaxID=1323731 RepID=A0ABY6YQ38_9ACTN|nr:hypothetical protein [Streptomonospora nanhaiensis]WAE73925.1 hypothetical protein OUQ99_02000 [Streptomonospora nanhaiensis]
MPDGVLHYVLAETADALGAGYARRARRAGPAEREAAWEHVDREASAVPRVTEAVAAA